MKPTIQQHNIVSLILEMNECQLVEQIQVETFKNRHIVFAESPEISFEFLFLDNMLISSFSKPQQEYFYEKDDIHYYTHTMCPKPLRKSRFDSIMLNQVDQVNG